MTAASLLFALLLAPPATATEPPGVAFPDPHPAHRSAAELDAKLGAPLKTDFEARPGQTLLDALGSVLPDVIVLPHVSQLDPIGLGLRDLTVDRQVTFPAGRVTARQAYEELLDGFAEDEPLALLNDGGVLKITTRDYADEYIVTRLYPVRDLLEAAGPSVIAGREAARPVPMGQHGGNVMGGGGGAFSLPPGAPANFAAALVGQLGPAAVEGEEDATEDAGPLSPLAEAVAAAQPLIDLIQSVTGGAEQGGGWEDIDGTGGTIEIFNGVLVVRQTDAVHRQIEELLTHLRAAFEAREWAVSADTPAAQADGGEAKAEANDAPSRRPSAPVRN